MGTVTILERPVFGVAEAAGYLSLRPARVRAWLDGYERRGTTYPPVVRERPTGSDIVTWGEYVELRYLKEYRANDISLQSLRGVVDVLREELETPYPFATAKLFIHGRELAWKVQEDLNLPTTLAVVVRTGQGFALAGPASDFMRRVKFDEVDGHVATIHPAGELSPVVMMPERRFGRPTVNGITTERLWELVDAGEPAEWLAEVYEINLDDLRHAVSFEDYRRSLAA